VKADFHIHTMFSDGVFSPERVVDTALDVGLEAFAITDHDNVLSYEIAKKYIKENNLSLELVNGVEINTIYNGYEIHILGYFMNNNDDDFQKMLKQQQKARITQAKEILTLLKKREGITVKMEDLERLVAPGGSIGRPHIAKAVTAAGGSDSVTEVYNKYINDNSNVYVQRKTVTPHDAVEVIYDAGGIPVFAHPFDVDIAESLTKELMQHGLRGLEAYHRKHSPAMVEYFSSMAEKLGLIVTGGSDFHAPNPNNGQIIMGKNFIPDWIYQELNAEKKRIDMA